MAAVETTSDHLDLGEHNHHAVGLRRDALSFTETLAQSIANIAPTATPAVNLQLVFASSGNGTWFTYVVATLGLVLIGICINAFAKQTATPGSLYSYVTTGLGTNAGFATGWGLILAYLTTGIAVIAGSANYATTLLDKIHIHMPPYVLYLILAGLVWMIAYRDVRLSAKMMLIMEMVSVSLITILGVVMLTHKGFHIDTDQLSLKGMDLKGLQTGLVLGIFSYVGFESATTLGAEAKEPRKTIPRAVILSTVLAGAFFVLMSFIMVSGFRGYSTSLDKVPASLDAMADIAHVPVLGIFVSIGAIVSLFACALACVTAVSRILLAMARDGIIPSTVGQAHDNNATPHVAATISAIGIFLVPVAMSLKGFGMLDIYGLNGTIATYGFLLAYILVAIGAIVFLARQKAASALVTASGIVGILFMGMAVLGSVYPWPAAPYNSLPPIFAGYMVLGFFWLWLSAPIRDAR